MADDMAVQPRSRRALPPRSKSSADGMPTGPGVRAGKRPLTRCHTSDGTDARLKKTTSSGTRKKKKGIRVAITVQKREDDEKPSVGNEEDLNVYKMDVHCSGHYSKKSCWPDIDSFWEDRTIDKDIMCDLLEEYTKEYHPERRDEENLRPKRCYIRDEPLRGISLYKDYGWDPIKLNLRADKQVEIQESWTRHVTLEQIPVDFSTDLNKILIDQGDKAVTSTLKKSKLAGHPLALSMMKSDTQIITNLRGLESVVFVFGNDEKPDDIDEETGESIWRDVKTLRALLHDKPVPQKEGKGTQRLVEVVALESYIKARVNYTCSFEGDVVSDHGIGLLLGERWWARPLKDIMAGYNVNNAVKIYEDIELRFFSEIGYKMDNEYFDWENHGGKWIKVKKLRNP